MKTPKKIKARNKPNPWKHQGRGRPKNQHAPASVYREKLRHAGALLHNLMLDLDNRDEFPGVQLSDGWALRFAQVDVLLDELARDFGIRFDEGHTAIPATPLQGGDA